MLTNRLHRRTSAFNSEGLRNTPHSIWWEGSWSKPSSSRFPSLLFALAWFYPKALRAGAAQASVPSSPSCSCVLVRRQTADVRGVYSKPKDKTLWLSCQEKTEWQQAWMRHTRVWFQLFRAHRVSMMTALAEGYMITTTNLYIHQKKRPDPSQIFHSLSQTCCKLLTINIICI